MKRTYRQFLEALVACPVFQMHDFDGDKVKDTFCNWGLQLVAEGWHGCKTIRGKSANALCEMFAAGAAEWEKVSAEQAQVLANEGCFVVACKAAAGHGHVAAVAPGAVVDSGKWKGKAPVIANIGKETRMMTANFAFQEPCDFYLWKGGPDA